MPSTPFDKPRRTHFFDPPCDPAPSPTRSAPKANLDLGDDDSDTLRSGCGGPGFGAAGDGIPRDSRSPRRRSCYSGHG
jgi:hypothetical protein